MYGEEKRTLSNGKKVTVQLRETAHHGFIAGALVNFRYRHNLRVYLEQFAGRGYADIVLVPRGKDRSLNAIPIIIELKAATKEELKELEKGGKTKDGSQTTPAVALKQAEDYTKGFQPNVMRVLTTANDILCVGVNLDYPSPISDIMDKSRDQKITPLFDEVLVSINEHNNRKIDKGELKERIQNNIERIYHTFPGTGEKGYNHYFSRDLLGQSTLLNEALGTKFEKHVFIYSENIPTEIRSKGKDRGVPQREKAKEANEKLAESTKLDESHAVVSMVLIPKNDEKLVYVVNVIEADGRAEILKKGVPLDNLNQKIGNRKIAELNLNFNVKKQKSDFKEYFDIEANEYASLEQYNNKRTDKFQGAFENVPYPNELKETFDRALNSQLTSAQSSSIGEYNELFKKLGEAIFPFKSLVNGENDFQAVLDGAFNHYSDLRLQESPETTALVLTEFQTGRGKRADMLVHGIKFEGDAKEYTPIGLELKGPRSGVNVNGLKREANDQITKEYERGVTYKTLTDGDEVKFIGVVFDKKASDEHSLVLASRTSEEGFIPVKVVHSSIHMIHPDTVAQPIDRPKGKPLGSVEEVIRGIKYSSIQEEDRRTLESATAAEHYDYWLQEHDIADIARIKYGYGAEGANTLFSIVGSPEHISSQLQQFQNSVRDGEQRPLTLIVNLNNNHWVTLVVSHQDGQYSGYYADSLGNNVPDDIRQVLQQNRITNLNDVSILQQTDGHNCGLWALENARDINAVLQGSRSNIPNEIHNHLQVQRDENHFISSRRELSERLSVDQQRIDNLQNIISAETQQSNREFDPNICVGQSSRSKRSINNCLFSRDDVEKFSKGKVDENNVDKIVIDSEKFLTYVKGSQDEGKNAQLIKFVEDKSIEGDHKYLLDKVVGDRGYKRYVQNERIKDLHGDIVHQDSGLTKNPKLKSRLMNAAGGIQLIRGIHGAIVSCKDGTATDCGLNLGGIGWSFASQPIENVMVKITPKVVASAEKVVGKIIPGTLGKQTKFVVRVAGVKFGSTIAKGAAGAIAGVFDIIDIGISANNLVDCKNRESSDNPCGEKEIRDNIASISFSGVSFVSGVALTAAGMPVVGIGVGFGLMVGYGVYSGISNIVGYEKKYDTTHGENWSIFWKTILFQDMASDVQHLADRKNTVDNLAKEVWKALNNAPNSVVAYGVGLGKVSDNTLRPDYAKILMDKEHADTRSISRVIPDSIKNAKMICLPHITNADYEKGLKKSVPAAVHYCDNAMVIADGRKSMQNGKTIVYDLRNVNSGNIIGSNVLDNSFLIFEGSEKIIGGDNTVNRFVLTNSRFAGRIIVGTNSTNVFDLSQIADSIVKVNIGHSIGSTTSKTLHSGVLEIKMNDRSLINECVTNDVNILGYHYIGRQNKTDEVSCTSSTGDFIDYDTIIDSKGGYNNDKRDIIENCNRAIILPYTDVRGTEGNYVFYIKATGYKGKDLHSEINVKGTGTVIFPETDLLNDCDEITYSSNNNTLSLKIGLGQNNRYTLDIKNYIKQSTSEPNFVLIDKNGSNIVPKIKELGTTKINSFELHSEYSLNKFDDVETHYKKILKNNKGYKVLSVIRGKTQSQDNSVVPHMVFDSSGDDVINFDQGTMFARGGKGRDVYVITDDINNKEVKIDNSSDDEKIDTLFMPEVEKDFLVQQCDLHLNYNNTSIQVKNYLQDRNYRHLVIMNKKGEAFIPDIQSISCSSSGKGKLVPFLQATQTQNMFLLPKDFQDDHVVIDSHLEDIKKYKDKDDLLLMRESEIPFIIRIEDFYNDQSKWRDINFLLWNNGNFSQYLGLQQEVNGIIDYQDKLKGDYRKIIKEYNVDFTQSISITHNQDDTLTSLGNDEERIGVVILKNIAPDRIKVSSSNTDLVFSDEVSNHTINIKNWNNSESYRISMLEFDLGLEPIIIRKLDGFSLSEVKKIQDLIEKASDNYQKRTKYAPNIEKDFKCLVSVNGFKSENKTYECLGFSSLQDQINFTENFCSAEQIEEFKGKIPNNDQVLLLLKKLQNDLSLNGYDQNIIDQYDRLMITSGLGILKLLINNAAQKGEWERVKDLLDTTANRSNADIENKKGWSSTWTLLHYAVYNGNLDLLKDTYQLLLSKVIDVNAKDKYGWTPLYYAIYYNEPEMVEFFIDKGANIDIKNNNGKTPLEVANEYGKPKIISILINKVVENGQCDVVKNFLKKTAKEVKVKDKNEWKTSWKLLHYAAYNGKIDVLRDLFDLLLEKSGGDINVQENQYGWTPLHYAVYYGRSEMVEFLIDKGANTEIKDETYGATSLHWAAYCDANLDIIKFLVEKGANMNAKNKSGKTPLDLVRDRKNSKVQQFLDENNGLSPLHYAAKEGNLDLLKVLLNKGDNINAKDKYGWTPLHYAVEHNRFDVMKLLIDSSAISIEAKDRNGKTPLHVAARQGCITSINLLLGKGANVTAKTNNSDWNWTPLHYAVYYNKPDAVKYLMGRGANVKVRDKKGNTPAYYAVGGHRAYDRKKRSTSDSSQQSYAAQSQEDREDRLEVLELLISEADIGTKNNDDQTLFHIAAQGRRLRAVRLLVNKIESVNFEDSLYEEPNELIRAVRQRERLKSLINEKDKFGYTPLQYAAKNSNWGMVNLFLDKTAERNPDDVANKDQFSISWTTVHYAVYNGDLNLLNDIFQFLSDKETIINTKDNSGWTPLHYAVYYNAFNVVKFLISESADIGAKDRDGKIPLDLANRENDTSIGEFLKQTQLGLDEQLLTAVQDCNLSKAKVLISRGANVNTKNDDGYTSLHFAVLKNFLAGVYYLIEEGANIDAKDNIGRAPLHLAARNGYLGVVQAVTEEGANLDVKDKDNKTPSDLASWKEHDNIVQYLKQAQLDKKLLAAVEGNDYYEVQNLVSQGASIDAKGKDSKAPLDVAKDKEHGDIVTYLQQTQLSLDKQFFTAVQDGSLNEVKDFVSRGANINAKDKDGKTPLHYASQSFHRLDIVKYLISKDADIDAKDSNDRTPLDVADSSIIKILRQAHLDKELLITVQSSDLERIKSLIAQGVSKDKHGAYYFAWIGNLGTVKFIVENEGGVNVTDKYGCTLLHWAARGGHLEIVKFLLEKGANINTRSILGRKPIHVAAINNRKNIVEFFISKGADINDADKDGWTPLHWAASRGNLEVTKFLVEKGANISAENVFGRKPIHRAAENNHKNIIDFLLSKGASVDDADKQGHTPLYWASWGGHLDMVKYLIGKGADINAKDKGGKTPLGIARDKGYNNIVNYLEEELNKEREKPVQRKRRHHHGDHARHHMSRKPLAIDSSNQPEIATSSGIRPSSWINDCISWVKSSVGRLLSSKSEGTASSVSQVDGQFAKASISNSSFTGTTLPSDGKDKRQENGGFFRDNVDYVNANLKRMCERQAPVKFKPKDRNTILEMGDHYLSQIDFNGTITLFDLLIRRVTGQKYISTVDQSISPLEAQEYTLNITKGFEKVVEQAALKSGISMHRLNIDYMGMQKEITKKVMSGKFNEISGILKSYVEKACPGEESGKLSPKKFDKFIAQLNKGLLNQSIEQILHNKDGTLEVGGAKQMSLEPQSYLSNASVHSYSEVSNCLSEIGVTKLGGNLNR